MRSVGAHDAHPVARLLVADDEPTIRELLTDFFVLEGYEVTSVADGKEALDVLGTEHFDAVLLDLKMPGFNG
ncbi:MAG: response regulator, partial [Myxococcota bacterium]